MNIRPDSWFMAGLFSGSIWKSSVGLAGGFFGAFLGIFISRVFLSNNVDSVALGFIFGVNGLTALAVVLAVEGFTSAVPLMFVAPEKHVKGLLVVSTLLTVLCSLTVFIVAGLVFPDYGFVFEYWWLFLLSVVFTVFVSAGQTVEVVSSMVGRNWVSVWRRTSVQFVGLGLFIAAGMLYPFMSVTVESVTVWFVCVLAGSVVAFVGGLWLLVRGTHVVQVSVVESWQVLRKNYVFHHLSKLGTMLPRFVIPIIVLGLFGFTVNSEFVVLWTVLGLLASLVGAVSRGYMSHYALTDSWGAAWKVLLVLVGVPMVLAGIFNSWVVGLFGVGFATLGGLFLVGLLGLLPYSVVDLFLARLRVAGRVRLSSLLSVLSGVCLVACVVLFGLWFGWQVSCGVMLQCTVCLL